jgi:hypothetical protein
LPCFFSSIGRVIYDEGLWGILIMAIQLGHVEQFRIFTNQEETMSEKIWPRETWGVEGRVKFFMGVDPGATGAAAFVNEEGQFIGFCDWR